jgi:hypothetical protein
MTVTLTGRLGCPCTETWDPLPLCEGETETSYAHGLWVHPDCGAHNKSMKAMQDWIKEMRGDDV